MSTPTHSATSEHPPVIRFGGFELDLHNRELRKQGQRVRLQVQPFQVLALLIECAGNVVTREELRQKLWPSSVYVDFDHGLNNAITRLREALGDAAATPRFIETLPRHGYRFIHPLENGPPAESADPAAPAVGETAPIPERPRRRQAVAITTVALAIVAAGALWFTQYARNATSSTTVAVKAPSIAVLPFANLSSEPDGQNFSDGLTDELANKLADIRGLKVAGRTSSTYYKQRQEPLSAIARALKVNYVLDGSVQRAGPRLRITAQLTDANEGAQLWSQRFDRSLTDVFQIQEDIAFAVATALQLKLLDTDEQRLRKRGTRDAEAYRLYVIGNAQLIGISVPQNSEAAKQLLDQALARDPDFAAAHAGIAYYHFRRAYSSLTDMDEGVRLGMAAAERALALDPESSEALHQRANFAMVRYRFLGNYQAVIDAHADYRRAIQLDPANEVIYFNYGRAFVWQEPQLAQDLFRRAAEIEPLAAGSQLMGAVVLSIQGKQEQARKHLQEALAKLPTVDSRGGLFAAGIEAQVGRLADAVKLIQGQGLEQSWWRWALQMSLGDLKAAAAALERNATPLQAAISGAARFAMRGRNDQAFELLDRLRGDFERSRVLDVPAARFALITGNADRAVAILEQRLPDIVTGVEPINGRNVIPALDLVAAWQATSQRARAEVLRERIAKFLDGPASPQLSKFVFLRARTHALAGESQAALDALDRAYDGGFRTLWAVDLHPQPFLYLDSVETDPAFAALRKHPRYVSWLARTKADNARQLEALSKRAATPPPA